MGRRHKYQRQHTDFVEPDLPIVPMLDMSFQLMAFFLITFRPMPVEGQLALALPAKEGGGTKELDPLENVKAKEIIVYVYSGPDGRIRKMEIDDGTGFKNLGAKTEELQKTLKALAEKAVNSPDKKVGKLKLEIDRMLLHEYVVSLIDVAIRAGFTDVSPEPLDEHKAAAG